MISDILRRLAPRLGIWFTPEKKAKLFFLRGDYRGVNYLSPPMVGGRGLEVPFEGDFGVGRGEAFAGGRQPPMSIIYNIIIRNSMTTLDIGCGLDAI